MISIILTVVIMTIINTLFMYILKLKTEVKDWKQLYETSERDNEKLRESMFKILADNALAKRTPKVNEAVQETTITKEPDDAPDDMYNLILQQWIYGATEDKEGGIDG